ncbi:GNAT family N-acetyltransferase [Methylobacterium radiotolerans]|jgi:uncharacterized protein|uniref:GNAT family N-acetyltransferase n=1 Tax=Methylobacterium TaxID=407 RepID=UPI00075142F1|nr:GNAT family N-acetyltransferase [Methylobacterium organophilum]MBN6821662.1 GNAT family N-acetyltransferase [Methylobacterium organophilum]OXE38323.1 GNAT family N-acetyltransferase [Methylobacterium radiotolerans]
MPLSRCKHGPDGVPEITPADTGPLLALNNAHAAELSLLDEVGLSKLVAWSFRALRIGRDDAFLIALDERHPTYAGPNYLWFRSRYLRFVYVDRVVVAGSARGLGHARRLYEDLFRNGREAGHDLIVCEVNSMPPNPSSDAIHARLGFEEVGAATIHGGAKTVRYLALRLPGPR